MKSSRRRVILASGRVGKADSCIAQRQRDLKTWFAPFFYSPGALDASTAFGAVNGLRRTSTEAKPSEPIQSETNLS
ncbi:uncharacterized protein PSFLO_01427 [Pseudozyma flocculosa]|uniref:Uncharacterized protein n=1 Tax=Pseudozyma flocculosa TaxID=84751 RepID=A0A5C3EWI8_9BASI|nr:uncharacterized protein PSFLO_01427 [Pseudozyma flocculosa]